MTMSRIGPGLTHAHLARSGDQTIKGEGLVAGLPGWKRTHKAWTARLTKQTANWRSGSVQPSPLQNQATTASPASSWAGGSIQIVPIRFGRTPAGFTIVAAAVPAFRSPGR